MNTLTGKRVLVTGGGTGLGAAVVEELASLGASVAIHYRTSEDAAAALAQKIRANGGTAVTVRGDLTVEAEAAAVVRSAADQLGGLDGLVNNAGDIVSRKRLEEETLDHWRTVAAVNVESLLVVTREAVRYLSKAQGGASVVNVASLAGRKGGHTGSLAYSSAKGAVLTMTRMLAVELAPLGIRVNAVAPGFIEGTKFHAVHTTREAALKTIEGIPLRRSGVPADVGRAVAFLISEFDGFITGATLDINGGVYCA